MRRLIAAVLFGAAAACACTAQPLQPSFADRRDYDAVSYTVAVGDVNNDGIPDLVSGYGGTFAVQFGNGDGTFRAGPMLGQPNSVFALVLADINRDGNLDIIFATSSGIALCYGNGDGTFQLPIVYIMGDLEGNEALVVGDFNGDHLLDVATPGSSGVWLLLGAPSGGFSTPQVILSEPAGVLMIGAADLNADGNLDLIVNGGPGIQILLGNGDGTFAPPQGYSVPAGGNSLAIADLNGDGILDLATIDEESPYAAILLGKGDGTFQNPTTTYLPGGYSIAAGDVNGDGIPDLVTQDVFVALGNGDGTFQSPIFYPVGSNPDGGGFNGTQVVLSHLRKTSGIDIVTANNLYDTLSVLLNIGQGKFSDGEFLRVSGQPSCAAAADFNGDGKPDLVFSNGNGITILLGTGKADPAYSLPGSEISVPGGYCVAAADFNHDGFMDLAVMANTAQNIATIVVFLGQGNGTFVQSASMVVNVYPGVPVVADFNHDGNPDIALSGNLIAFGNGDGTFQTPVPFVPNPPLFANFAGLAAADLNGDGYPDIVIADTTDNSVYIMLNKGNGTFKQDSLKVLVGCFAPDVPQLADLNGDGIPDLELLCQSQSVEIFLGNGNGTFQQPPTIVPAVWSGVYTSDLLVTDLNGDGKLDMAVLADHSLFVFTGNGDGTFNTPVPFGVGPNPRIAVPSHLHRKPASTGTPDVTVTDAGGAVLVLLNTTP
jgi:hypothetical protein